MSDAKALVVRRDYLDPQRKRIIARALASSLAGALPLPFVDDWAASVILGRGYRKIASAHHIDIDDQAVSSLVFGAATPPSILNMAVAGVLLRIASRAARRMMVVLATANRARAAARTYVTMTLFDHYCAKLHTGLAIDSATALALRSEIAAAIDATPGALSFQPFRRGALAAARAMVRAPLELADIASRGALRRMLARRSGDIADAEAIDQLDAELERSLAPDGGALARAVASVEVQLASETNPFLESALDNLDRRWRARIAAAPRGT